MAELDCWHVGRAPEGAGRNTGVVALAAGERAQDGPVVPLFDALDGVARRAPRVEITLPVYRGKALVRLLGWLAVHRLAEPGAEISWWMTKRQGPASIQRMLAESGWRLEKERGGGGLVRLRGTGPEDAEDEGAPVPRSFAARVGARELTFSADYGVFSPERVDDGTDLLLQVALDGPPVSRLADIGVGYGALAVGLVANGVAGSAVGTDVDAIALWLARENARRAGVELTPLLSAEPADAEPTPLTVCNVPTHLDADETRAFMASLVARGRAGRLLAVVHASLERRYAAHLAPLGALRTHPGPSHVVFETAR